MGFLKKDKKGVECSRNEDGSQTCARFILDKQGNKIATGTEFTVSANPSNNCEVMLTGDTMSMMDGEEEDVDRISRRVVAGCKKGLV